MSSDTSSVNVDNIDVDIKKAFSIVGIVVSFLMFLVILRYGCNIFIDVFILRDPASLMRAFSDIRRKFVPWYHPRTEPQGAMQESADVESGQELINMDRILSGLTPQQKKDLLASILTTKIVTLEDILAWKAKDPQSSVSGSVASERPSSDGGKTDLSGSSSRNSTMCPICIHDIEVGNEVVMLSACKHIFHRDCLSEWLSTHTRDCPYCRTEIISLEMMEEAYALRGL